jgi:hypothetical protein
MNFIQENYKTILVAVISFLILIILASWKAQEEPSIEVSDFEECARYYMVAPTHPAKCWTSDGIMHIQYAFDDERVKIDLDKTDWLVNDNNLEIEGEIIGGWFFEASFPAELWDQQGRRFAWSIATTQDDWMTMDLVPFKIMFEIPDNYQIENAILVLIKDNPSGLPEYDDALAWPIHLKYSLLAD